MTANSTRRYRQPLIDIRIILLSALILLIVYSVTAREDKAKIGSSLVKSSIENSNNENASFSLIDEYREKICNHSSTCDLVDKVPVQYRDLRTRDCMCDQKCYVYGDCCQDSKFESMQKEKRDLDFVCIATKADGNIYMKTSCPRTWNESAAIKENCETKNSTILMVDVLISTPVTSLRSNITYINLFCAICHNETEFTFWNIAISYAELVNETDSSVATFEYAEEKPSNRTKKPTFGTLLAALSVNDTAESFLLLTVSNMTYKCILHSIVPRDVSQTVRYCVPDVVELCLPEWQETVVGENCSRYTSYTPVGSKVYKNPFCVICNNVTDEYTCFDRGTINAKSRKPFSLHISQPQIPKIDHCTEIPEGNTAHSLFCPPTDTTPDPSTVPECYPSTNSQVKPCRINGYFKVGPEIEYVNKTTVYLKGWNVEYPEAEYLAINDTTIFVCGRDIPRTGYQQVMDLLDDWISEILIKLSIICLLLHLLFFQQLPELKNLSGKNLAAFCATLLVALLCFEIGPRLAHCEIISALMHYEWLSCFTWMLLMSYDCWLSLYRATKKFRSAGGKHGTKFVLYCIISNLVPAIIVSVAVYYQLAPADVIPCDWKPGYGKYDQCFISQKKALYVFFFLPASVMFLGNICFFAHTAFMIYRSQRQTVNPNTRNDFQLYTRLALMMGLTWTLGSLTTITNNEIIGLLFSTFNMSQGIFIFFGFTFKQKTLKSLLSKHKDSTFISNTLSTFITSDPSSDVVMNTANIHTETSICPGST